MMGMFFILVVFSHSDGAEQTATSEARIHSRGAFSLTRTEVFDLTTQRGDVYRIFTAEPLADEPVDGYPVMYVLDANANFGTVVEAYRRQSRGRPGRSPSPMVIIGIGYPTEEPYDFKRRVYDLTPPASDENLPKRPGGRAWPKSGGADEFLSFMQNELKPLVEKRFRIDQSRQSIFGHSLGGLFVLHALFTQPDSFSDYLAASPSVWWNDFAVLNAERQFSSKVSDFSFRKRLLITIGELELTEDLGPAANLPPTTAKEAFGNTKDFSQRLVSMKAENFSASYHEFSGKDHGSVIPFALLESLRFTLNTDSDQF